MVKRKFTAEYKASLVIEMLREGQHISEIAAREGIRRTQLQNWKRGFLDKATEIFTGSKSARESAERPRKQRNVRFSMFWRNKR